MKEALIWYETIIKPSWAPPAWAFRPVWLILYILIIASFGTLFYKVIRRKIPVRCALPFLLNLIFNVAFPILQFGLHNNFLASIDILLTLGTLIWAMMITCPYARWIAISNIPYALWLLFATALQLTITYLNL